MPLVFLQAIGEMDTDYTGDPPSQTYMIVWDIRLEHTNITDGVDMITPPFSLTPNGSENKNVIRIEHFADKLMVASNFMYSDELIAFKTYMIIPATGAVAAFHQGFGLCTLNNPDWCDHIRFIFEAKMCCDAIDVQPTIWKHCITETRPSTKTDINVLHLIDDDAKYTLVNNCGVPCTVTRFYLARRHNFLIYPAAPQQNWNLIALMFIKVDINSYERHYVHTTDLGFKGRSIRKFKPIVILQIYEASTFIGDLSDAEMYAVTSIINRVS